MSRARAPLAAVAAVAAWLAPSPVAAADAPLIDRAAAFVAVVRANDCRLSEVEGEALLPDAGLSMEDARDAVALLNRMPLFTVSDDLEYLILTLELCEADAAHTLLLLTQAAALPDTPRLQLLTLADRVDPTEAARLIGHIRANDCALTEDEAAARMPDLGFSQDMVQDILAVLTLADLAEIDGGGLSLAPALCDAPGAQDAPRIAALLSRMETAVETTP